MRGNEFLDKMELIDPVYVEAADRKPGFLYHNLMRWAAAAACLFLFFALGMVISHMTPDNNSDLSDINNPSIHTTPSIPNPSNELENTSAEEAEQTIFYYNEVTSMTDAARLYIPGYFTEELDEKEIAAIEPGRKTEWMQYSGNAGFDGEGNLLAVHLKVASSLPDTEIYVNISETILECGYFLPGEPVLSQCNDVEFTVYQYTYENNQITLKAETQIGDCFFQFEMDTSKDKLEMAKSDFEQVLECFTYYEEGTPDLSQVLPDAIPEWFDMTLTYAEAKEDTDYGQYMLRNIPEGYVEESIRRLKNQESDYLSGLWVNGYNELQWRICSFKENDAARLTSITDTKNYDLSLYPIPRAQSVPDDLREIVDNPIFNAEELTLDTVYLRAYKAGEKGDSNGWRMVFSVKYGDIIVEVRTKGIDPEWLYQQLKLIGEL